MYKVPEKKPYALPEAEGKDSPVNQKREHSDTVPLEYRTEYHRDRDRIIWSKAFKRLQHKTQVFPHYMQDHYRRRLTHSLEVSQIATTLARALGLNETATEAIALGHDLGHTPFGHAGEIALNDKIMQMRSGGKLEQGAIGELCSFIGRVSGSRCSSKNTGSAHTAVDGFDHCVHAIEIVSRIEREYCRDSGGYVGLNLTYAVRDGILKHMYDHKEYRSERPLSRIEDATSVPEYQCYKNNKGSLEAQCVYFADKLAYLVSDIEDGIRCHIFIEKDISESEFLRHMWSEYSRIRKIEEKLILQKLDDYLHVRRAILTYMILDCIECSEKSIEEHGIKTPADVLACGERMVFASSQLSQKWDQFHEEWMKGKLYIDANVAACNFKAKRIVCDLFDAYYNNPRLIDTKYHQSCERAYKDLPCAEHQQVILVRNYLAGMTDSYAIEQHSRLFMSSERVRFLE